MRLRSPRRPPSTTPRALAAPRAAFVRVEIHYGLVFSHSSKDMHCKPVGLGKIDRDKLHTSFHQRRDEVKVASKPIELGNYQSGTVQATQTESLGNRGAIITFPAFDLNNLLHKSPPPSVEVRSYRFSLRVETQTTYTLPRGRNSQVANELACLPCLHLSYRLHLRPMKQMIQPAVR